MAIGMRVGSELKAARKKAGMGLDVIAKRTKVKVDKLIALEKSDFKNLPEGFYLFSLVRAYAHEVHIDPEPIVAGLRTEFAEKDAMDALHALDAAGVLSAKKSANSMRSWAGRPNLFRNAAVAAGIVVTAAVGTGAYRYGTRGTADVRGTVVVLASRTPTMNIPEMPLVPLPARSPAPTALQALAPTEATKAKRSRKESPQETVATEEPADTPTSADAIAPAP